MQHNQHSSAGDGRLPVFVFPHALIFYADDQATHKQVLTIYNPYDFALRFKVLSTAPQKYVVVDAEGTIKPRCCIDIVIRHNAITPNNYGVSDKFRVQMQEHGHHSFGKKDISATLVAGRPEPGSAATAATAAAEQEQFKQLSSPNVSGQLQGSQYSIGSNRQVRGSSNPSFFVVLAAIVCIVALMLPTEGQTDSQLPTYLHITLHQKLIFAYTLGLVTMVILKTS